MQLNINLLEKYVFSKNKKQVLEELTPYQEHYKFLSLLYDLQQSPQDPNFEQKLQQYLNNSRNHDYKRVIRVKHYLEQLSRAEQDSSKLKYLQELNQLLYHFRFDDQKSVGISQSNNLISDKDDNKLSKITPEQERNHSLESALENFYQQKSSQSLNQIGRDYWNQMDFSKFPLNNSNLLNELLRSFNPDLNNKTFIPFLEKVLALKKQPVGVNDVLSKLPFEDNQRLVLKSQHKNYFEFLRALYFRRFGAMTYDKKEEEVRREIGERVKYLEESPEFMRGNIAVLRRNLLGYLHKLDVTDEDLLVKYLENPTEEGRVIIQPKQKQQQQAYRQYLLESLCYNDIPLEQIVMLTLQQQEKVNVNGLRRFFEEKELGQMEATARFLRGESVEMDKYFRESEIKQLNERKELSVTGKSRFEAGEEVSLKVKLKNIKTLRVRVFEVNSEHFLLQNDNEDYSEIKVECLIPSEEYQHSFTEPSAKTHSQTLSFQSLSSKERGVFVVDLVGEEKKAQAVIKKGSLTLLYDNLCGRRCVLVDEQNRVCLSERTGIYLKNKFLRANPTNGLIKIPEELEEFSGKVVAVHDGFAAKVQLSFQNMTHSLSFFPLYNIEEIIPGREARLVLQTKLLLNEQRVSLNQLKGVEVELTFEKFSGSRQNKKYSGLELNDQEDLFLEFLVPSKVTAINIKMSAEINKKAKKTVQLTHEENLYFMRSNQGDLYDGAVLRNPQGEYLFECFGSNGEKIIGEKFSVTFEYLTHSLTHQPAIELFTDSKGQINLGLLQNIRRVTLNCHQKSFSFPIQEPQRDSLPTRLFLTENTPFHFNNPQRLRLINYTSDGSLDNLMQLVKQEGQRVQVAGLKKGRYTLYFTENKSVDLIVEKGEVRQLNGEVLVQKDRLIAYSTQENRMGVEVKQTTEEYQVELLGATEKTKCHLLLSNYSLEQASFLRPFLENSCPRKGDQLYHDRSSQENTFYSNGKLHDELVYVQNRKNAQSFMGNTLDKPQMILKRQRVKETSQKDEVLREAERCRKGRSMARKCVPERACYARQYNASSCRAINTIREFISNDPSQPHLILPNQKLSEGKFSVSKKDLGNYNFVYLLASGENGSIARELTHNDRENETIDLRLKETRKSGSIFRYDRSMDYMPPNTKFTIPHVSKQEFSFLEDTKDLFTVLKLVSQRGDVKDWEFLSEWETLSSQEKLKKYDKYCSHDLNFFLCHRDKEFFEGVVLPFISNKKEKTLSDYYFLDQDDKLDQFRTLSQISQLPTLELVMLYEKSLKNRSDFAQKIYDYVKMNAQMKRIDEQFVKKTFDSILSSSQKDEDKPMAPPPEAMMNQHFSNMVPQQVMMQMDAPVRAYRQTNNRAMVSGRGRFMQAPQTRYMDMRMDEEVMELNAAYDDMDDEDSMAQEMDEIEVFQPMQATVEYKEKNYYAQSPSKEVFKFWLDIMNHLQKKGSYQNFFSENFTQVFAMTTLPDMLAAFTLLDLPFQKKKATSQLEGDDLKIQTQTPLVCLTKEIIEEEGKKGTQKVMLSQRFFDQNDKYEYSEENPDEKFEKPVDVFVRGKVYQCDVVVTNPSSTPLKLQVIYEIPQGSIPFNSLDSMKIEYLRLEPLQSRSLTFEFYFPREGKFRCYPATVVKEDEVLAVSDQVEGELEVLSKKPVGEMKTIADILSQGNIEDIVGFLESKNLFNRNIFNPEDILWLLKNKEFYQRIVATLRKRGFYQKSIWKYSILHQDLEGVRELLQDRSVLGEVERVLPYLDTKLVSVDTFQVFEYHPLVNPRTHSLRKSENNILNEDFKKTYQKLLGYLLFKKEWSCEDRLVLINYLLLQDRIQEAIDWHKSIDQHLLKENESKIQYDYLTAYLDFVTGYPEFKKAKEICDEYIVFPVLTWRNLFVEMVNQLAEFEETELLDKELVEEQEKSNLQKAKSQPSFNAEVKEHSLLISFENMTMLTLKCYKVDLEAFFSLHPFQDTSLSQYALVAPYFEKDVCLPQTNSQGVFSFALPEEVRQENLFIELSNSTQGNSQSQYLQYFPFSLRHLLNKEFGILKVVDKKSNKPVPKVYMKCFAKYKNGSTKFYKDGYTDIRGSFDYVSLNKDNLDDIKVFKILIHSQEHGSKIIEAEPPVKIGRVEGKATKIISQNWRNMQQRARATKNAYKQVLF